MAGNELQGGAGGGAPDGCGGMQHARGPQHIHVARSGTPALHLRGDGRVQVLYAIEAHQSRLGRRRVHQTQTGQRLGDAVHHEAVLGPVLGRGQQPGGETLVRFGSVAPGGGPGQRSGVQP